MEPITRFYQQCDPATPLPAGDPRYVSFEGVRGHGDLVDRVAHSIRRADQPVHMLFAGHRGCGKSTELLRLQKLLADPSSEESRFFVVFFEANEEDLDVNDVDFPDLLLSIVRHIGKSLDEKLEKKIRPNILDRFVSSLRDLLGNVAVDKVEGTLGFAKLTATIKNSPSARAKIREALEPGVSNLLVAANEILTEAVTFIRTQGYRDLVLIVDNLDRIVLRDVPGASFNTHEQLFINRGSQMAQLSCHVVYTIPISMIFSPKANALINVFGRRPDILPMVKIVDRSTSAPDPDGLASMREMVLRRLKQARVETKHAFDSDTTLDYLCTMSGGHARNLLVLIRSACDWLEDLPVTRAAAESAVQDMSNAFERALNRPEYFRVLQQIDKSGDLPGSDSDELLLYSLCVLEYLNGEVWYAVNPAVQALRKYKEATIEQDSR